MTRQLLIPLLTLGCLLTSVRLGRAQDVGAAGFGYSGVGGAGVDSIGNAANLGGALNPGIVGGGESMPGAILVRLTGEVQCTACTLEELGLDETPGSLYQFSQDNTHMVIKVTSAAPDIAWEMVENHKLFLQPGEDAGQLQRLLNDSKAGKRVEVTGGVAPEVGTFIPLTVKVK